MAWQRIQESFGVSSRKLEKADDPSMSELHLKEKCETLQYLLETSALENQTLSEKVLWQAREICLKDEELSLVKQALAQMSKIEYRNAQLEFEIDSLRKNTDSKEIEKYKELLQKAEIQVQEYKQSENLCKLEYENLRKSTKEYLLKVNMYEKTTKEYEIKIEDLEQQSQELHRELEDIKVEKTILYKKYTLDLKDLKKELNSEQLKKDQLKNKVNDLNCKINDLQNTQKNQFSLSSSAITTRDKVIMEHQSSKINQLMKENQDIKNRNLSLENELKDNKISCESQLEEIAKLQNEMANLGSQLNQMMREKLRS